MWFKAVEKEAESGTYGEFLCQTASNVKNVSCKICTAGLTTEPKHILLRKLCKCEYTTTAILQSNCSTFCPRLSLVVLKDKWYILLAQYSTGTV